MPVTLIIMYVTQVPDIAAIVHSLTSGISTWEEESSKYPSFEQQETTKAS